MQTDAMGDNNYLSNAAVLLMYLKTLDLVQVRLNVSNNSEYAARKAGSSEPIAWLCKRPPKRPSAKVARALPTCGTPRY